MQKNFFNPIVLKKSKKAFAGLVLVSIFSLYIPAVFAGVEENGEETVSVEHEQSQTEEIIEESEESEETRSSLSLESSPEESSGTESSESEDAERGEEIENGTHNTSEIILNEENGTSTITSSELENELTATSTPPEILEETATSTESLEGENPGISIATSTLESGTTTLPIDHSVATSTLIGTTTITTGDILEVADVSNVINTNLINSTGTIAFITATSTLDDIDLSHLGNPGGGTGTTSPSGAEVSTTTILSLLEEIQNRNLATTTNNVSLNGVTGENTINAEGGNAEITTGSTTLIANIFNMVNTNIINSDYLVFVVNQIGNLAGDIILPAANFFTNLFGGGRSGGEESGTRTAATTITNDNDAIIENNLDLYAGTGENNSTGTTTEVRTGDVNAFSNIVNLANTNLFNTKSVYIVLNVLGNWLGKIVGLPDNLSLQKTDRGFVITSKGNSIGENGTCCQTDSVSRNIENENTAVIVNNLHLSAETGNNTILGSGTSSITTGDAKVLGNVINVANLNIIDSSWFLGLVNVLGDFSGDVSFGESDISISKSTDAGSVSAPGDTIRYNLLIKNEGDTEVTDIQVEDFFDKINLITFIDLGGGNLEGGTLHFSIDKLLPGMSRTISYEVRVKDDIPIGESDLTNTVNVEGNEHDKNNSNNSDSVTVTLERDSGDNGGGATPTPTPTRNPNRDTEELPKIRIEKTNNARGSLEPGDVVSYHLLIKNLSSEKMYESEVKDILRDPDNEILAENEWNLGTILPHEEIALDYDIRFNDNAIPGTFTNTAEITGKSADGRRISAKDSSSVEVRNFGVGGGEDGKDETSNTENTAPPSGLPGLPDTGMEEASNSPFQKPRFILYLASIYGIALLSFAVGIDAERKR